MSSTRRLRIFRGGLTCGLVLMALIPLLSTSAQADYPRLSNRSLRIDSAEPGATTTYTMSWRFPAGTTLGSVRLLLCADAYIEEPCSSTPPGDFSAATLVSQTGITGFTIASQTADEIILTRTPGAVGTIQSTYVFDGVINPTGVTDAFFVQISTYASSDASGIPTYRSSVTNATTQPIMINTKVPPILFFCAALTVDEWCENVGGHYIDYGDLSPMVTDVGTSQFGAATNAAGGYTVTINGGTMTAGNKIIEPQTLLAPNTPGVAQFGMNLRANTDPPAGQDVIGAGIGTVAAPYDTPDLFKYEDGDIVASAVTGTMFNIYTVTYIVNIPEDQPSGVYNTTITYICTASF